mgnify:CR=1 FL=1
MTENRIDRRKSSRINANLKLEVELPRAGGAADKATLETINISSSGVFIMSKKKIEVGQILTLALPFKKGKEAKVKGQIVWTNDEGFGIKFLCIDK